MTLWTPLSPAPWLRLSIAATEAGVCALSLHRGAEKFVPYLAALTGDSECREDRASAVLSEPLAQLRAYFRGELHTFEIPLDLRGTDFQRSVWAALQRIPFGETTSYGALAGELGMAGGARAVGAANGSNPVAIIVPCHRVVAADGSLGGYAGGLALKRWLLELEAAGAPPVEPPRQPAFDL
jgi:methylated-DNA-[protein]-cysteine S-methyltransferase